MIVALMGVLVASCNQSDEKFENAEAEGIAPVRVHVDGYSVSQEDISGARTRAATDIGNVNAVNAVTVAFYSGSTEVEEITQLKDDNTTYDT